jgi:hypothetical protein
MDRISRFLFVLLYSPFVLIRVQAEVKVTRRCYMGGVGI